MRTNRVVDIGELHQSVLIGVERSHMCPPRESSGKTAKYQCLMDHRCGPNVHDVQQLVH